MKNIKNKNFKPSFLLVGRFVVLLLPALILFSCSPNASDVQDLMDMQNKIMTETGTGIKIVYTQNAKPSIIISAKTAVRYVTETPYMDFTDGFILEMFDEQGNLESTLTSGFARMTENSNELIAQDSVVVLNKDGEKLNTDYLIWDKEAELIKSDSLVKITTKDEMIYGTGFISNDKFTDYTIFKISGIVNVKDDLE
jgi:LPS export ABC transporter protein LptC